MNAPPPRTLTLEGLKLPFGDWPVSRQRLIDLALKHRQPWQGGYGFSQRDQINVVPGELASMREVQAWCRTALAEWVSEQTKTPWKFGQFKIVIHGKAALGWEWHFDPLPLTVAFFLTEHLSGGQLWCRYGDTLLAFPPRFDAPVVGNLNAIEHCVEPFEDGEHRISMPVQFFPA